MLLIVYTLTNDGIANAAEHRSERGHRHQVKAEPKVFIEVFSLDL